MIKKRELSKLGILSKEAVAATDEALAMVRCQGVPKEQARELLTKLIKTPQDYVSDQCFCPLARLLAHSLPANSAATAISPASYKTWGGNIDAAAHEQMQNACSLPIATAGALMPDAHVGYGLPIGGVLATTNAVIPYAVGVDIGCRVRLTLLDISPQYFKRHQQRFEQALEENTSFGIGARWQKPRSHMVLDDPTWSSTRFLANLKPLAEQQLGTSGSGNHFVEFGKLTLFENINGLEPGDYLALVSHSGSRGPGSKVALHYSSCARDLHPELPKHLAHLSWLSLDSAEGQEYWEAMNLMGRYASANHEIIHRQIEKALGLKPFLVVENHHNFAWEEEHQGKRVIVHRKGATPAGAGVLGYIPGTMLHPGYLIRGKGNPEALDSCSHGAGRRMSRKEAKTTTTKHALKKLMQEANISLLSAGLDESPHAYKNIEEVMTAQSDLVTPLGSFQPIIVKMAPEGEKPEY